MPKAGNGPPEHIRLSDPLIFGIGIWFSIHIMAAAATTAERKKAFYIFIRTLVAALKCPTCRKHAMEYVKENPPEEFPYTTDEEGNDITLFEWSRIFHNVVNKRLGKPEYDFKSVYPIYRPDPTLTEFFGSAAEPCKNCGIDDSHEQPDQNPKSPEQIIAELNRGLVNEDTTDNGTGKYSYSVLGRVVNEKPNTDSVTYIPTSASVATTPITPIRQLSPPRAKRAVPKLKSR